MKKILIPITIVLALLISYVGYTSLTGDKVDDKENTSDILAQTDDTTSTHEESLLV